MKNIVQNRIIQHLGFWSISAIILLRIFSDGDMWSRTNMIYTFLFLFSLLPGIYFNLLHLIPGYLTKSKWIPYLLFLGALVTGTTFLNEFVFEVLVDIIFPGYYFISYYTIPEISQFVLVFLILTTLIKMSRSHFDLQSAQRQMERMHTAQMDSELSALKAQLNPHFLFNGLHSIYSLSLENNSRAPEFILKLSEVLRFILYETNPKRIPLRKELNCIREYMDIQKLRLPQTADIQYEIVVEGESGNKGEKIIESDSKSSPFEQNIEEYNYVELEENLEIAPLLLMPLVENAFKHGILGANESTYVHVQSRLAGNQLIFSSSNSMSESREINTPGIGLKNLRRRLELLYPGKHKLDINESKVEFNLKLSLTLR